MAADNTIMMLGLAMKAGKVISGETGCENSIRDGSACLVILAEDASANTMKKFKDKCSFYNVPIFVKYKKDEIGKAIGRELRSVAAVTDKGFADALSKKLGQK